jgi:hypothetical protein
MADVAFAQENLDELERRVRVVRGNRDLAIRAALRAGASVYAIASAIGKTRQFIYALDETRICEVEGCTRKIHARGRCAKHYPLLNGADK